MNHPREAKPTDSERITGEHVLGDYDHFARGEDHTVLPAAHRFAVLTCMDARIDPTKLVGLRGSEAHVIRNAGGRATEDAIRSLVLSSKLLGTRAWYVVQHSHCGMALLTEELTRELLGSGPRATSAAPVKLSVPSAGGGGHVHKLALHDQEQSIAADVARIRNHPLVPVDVPVYGYIYEVETGRFVEVPTSRESAARPVREVTSLPRVAAR
jgi:carbonic anhydrase